MWAIIVVGLLSIIFYEFFAAIKVGCGFIFMTLTLFWLVILFWLF